MIAEYPGTYSDRRGMEPTKVRNNGTELTVKLRGVTFTGSSFDTLDAEPGSAPDLVEQFTLCQGSLCACQIQCEIPLPVVLEGRVLEATLGIRLSLGEPAANGGIDREELLLSLDLEGHIYKSSGRSGWFEDEMLELSKSLPGGAYLKSCISCAFSDYSPYGHGLFGGLTCFRNCKEEYKQVRSKDDLFRIWDKNAGLVQETFLCPEFEHRLPGTGYRG